MLAALWIAPVIWTYCDIRARARDPWVQTLATLLVALLSLPRLSYETQEELRELSSLNGIAWNLCPGCGTPAAGMCRGEGTSVDEALKSLNMENDEGEVMV